LPLANRDSRRKEGRKQGSGKDPAPVVVHLVSESFRSFTIVSFKAAEGQRTTVGARLPGHHSLQRFLTIPTSELYIPTSMLPAGIRTYLPVTVSLYVFRTKARMRPDKSELSYCSNAAGISPRFGLIPAAGYLSFSAQAQFHRLNMSPSRQHQNRVWPG
jgi:hypothetical protein